MTAHANQTRPPVQMSNSFLICSLSTDASTGIPCGQSASMGYLKRSKGTRQSQARSGARPSEKSVISNVIKLFTCEPWSAIGIDGAPAALARPRGAGDHFKAALSNIGRCLVASKGVAAGKQEAHAVHAGGHFTLQRTARRERRHYGAVEADIHGFGRGRILQHQVRRVIYAARRLRRAPAPRHHHPQRQHDACHLAGGMYA